MVLNVFWFNSSRALSSSVLFYSHCSERAGVVGTLEPAAGSGKQSFTGVSLATSVTRATHAQWRAHSHSLAGKSVVYPCVYTLPLCLSHTDVFQLLHQTGSSSTKETLLGPCCINTTTVERLQMENHHRDTWQLQCGICMYVLYLIYMWVCVRARAWAQCYVITTI